MLEYTSEGFSFSRVIANGGVLKDPECRINVGVDEDSGRVLAKLLVVKPTLGDVCFVEDGINPGPFRAWLVATSQETKKHVQFIEGKTFRRYGAIQWQGKWFLWDKPAIKEQQKEHPTSIAVLGDEQRFLVPEKIVTRQTADGIIATLDTDQYFSTNSVHTTRAKPTSPLGIRFILGVLNSKVVSFFYRSNYKEKEGAFPQVKVNKLRAIPIPNAKAQEQTAIVRLVEDYCG